MEAQARILIALLAAGYILGSIPLAWIVARLVTGWDLRSLGSGNAGVMKVALNVTRWAGQHRRPGRRGAAFLADPCPGISHLGVVRLLSGSSFYATRVSLAVWPFLFGALTRSSV